VRGSREQGSRADLNPGLFTVKPIAEKLETTVGELLRERGYEVTKADLRSFRWIADFFQMRFPLDEVAVVPSLSESMASVRLSVLLNERLAWSVSDGSCRRSR
jgi:hypothetical protein